MTARFMEMPGGWSRAEWLDWRREGAGGSDVASICGLSTFGSPTSVYYDKVGLSPDEAENEAMQWGRLLEAPIAAEFAERTGLHVVVPQLLVWDEDQPWRRATLDGLVCESNVAWDAEPIPPINFALGTIQIKTTRDGVWDDDHGGIPDRVALQCQWELGVAGLQHCWLATLHGGQRLRIYEIEADPAAYAALCSVVDRFWSEHVVPQEPPPADSNPATTAAIKAAFSDRADGMTVFLDDEALHFAREWLPAKAALREAEAHVELIENRLRAALGDAIEGCDECGPVVSWKPQRLAGRVDEKALRAAHPDVYEAFKKPDGTTRVLRPAKALKEALA